MGYPIELTETYEIYEQIGEGGAGTIYRAVHKRLQKLVVLKRLNSSETNIYDCRTEVDILKNLRHLYLPSVIDFIVCSEGTYTVMDYIPGNSLAQMMNTGYRFTEKEVLKYMRQLCEALDYLHSQPQPIVHGDIKPDNIMITPEGNVCLIDFNISGILDGNATQALGYTPGYSSPEQIGAFAEIYNYMQEQAYYQNQYGVSAPTLIFGSDGRTVLLDQKTLPTTGQSILKNYKSAYTIDKRSDVYSLAATMYSLLTGTCFDVSVPLEAIPGVSDGFMVVLAKALQYSPEYRYCDAGQMLNAVINVHKKDRKYKRLLLRQELTIIGIILAMAISVFMLVEGRRTIEKEREENYYALVNEMEKGAQDRIKESSFSKIYEEAILLYPEYIDAYYAKANYLFLQGDFEGTCHYIEEVFSLSIEASEDDWGSIYHLYAECCFRLENYEKAHDYYKKALKYCEDNSSLYRDYAISLVYLDEMNKAKSVLEDAIDKKMDYADIYMVQGEIERMDGNPEAALESFKKVFELATDDYLLQRLYVMVSKTHQDIGTEEAILEDVTYLKRGIEELEMNNRLLLYERLAQDYISLGDMTEEFSYYNLAVETFIEIKEMGWDTDATYSNIVVLCMRTEDLDSAEKWAVEMLEKYPENYKSYMRMAYLEVEKQDLKENANRDYRDFETYYVKANELYQNNMSGNITDAEMQLLDNVYQQVMAGGWL